jgi:major vault protein
MFRIPPHHYLHVLDQTTNVTRLEIGPLTFVKKDNELVGSNPEKMVIVPPRHFCVIANPVMRDENKQVLLDNLGQVGLG